MMQLPLISNRRPPLNRFLHVERVRNKSSATVDLKGLPNAMACKMNGSGVYKLHGSGAYHERKRYEHEKYRQVSTTTTYRDMPGRNHCQFRMEQGRRLRRMVGKHREPIAIHEQRLAPCMVGVLKPPTIQPIVWL